MADPQTSVAAELAAFDRIPDHCRRLREQLQRTIIGQDAIVELLVAAQLCQGHVLIVGVPGLAKTLMVRSLADAMSLQFRRIQFTPDMMPGDILGTELIQQDAVTGQRHMRFVPGPIFANLILADEVNRAPPKTQAALLEAMAERQVTVAGHTTRLSPPFVVVATQNPIEQEGTYPLPEAQLDRFMFSLWMTYPDRDDEVAVVDRTPQLEQVRIEPVLDGPTLVACQRLIHQMPVSRHVTSYAVDLARATRPSVPGSAQDVGGPAVAMTQKYVAWGAGPRAAQALVLGARTLAAMEGRPTPGCADVRRVAVPVLRHRIVLNYAATGDEVSAEAVVSGVLDQVQEADYLPR